MRKTIGTGGCGAICAYVHFAMEVACFPKLRLCPTGLLLLLAALLCLPALIALELAAVLIEALLYRYVTEEKRERCLLLSMGTNAVSYFLGGILLRLICR